MHTRASSQPVLAARSTHAPRAARCHWLPACLRLHTWTGREDVGPLGLHQRPCKTMGLKWSHSFERSVVAHCRGQRRKRVRAHHPPLTRTNQEDWPSSHNHASRQPIATDSREKRSYNGWDRPTTANRHEPTKHRQAGNHSSAEARGNKKATPEGRERKGSASVFFYQKADGEGKSGNRGEDGVGTSVVQRAHGTRGRCRAPHTPPASSQAPGSGVLGHVIVTWPWPERLIPPVRNEGILATNCT